MFRFLLVFSLLTNTALAAGWSYDVNEDNITGEKYSFARGWESRYGGRYFTLMFVCRGNELNFEIDADTYIAQKGESFPFQYRIDDLDAKGFTMRTFSNSSTGGFSYESAKYLADELKGANSIFVRAITWDNEYIEAKVSLRGSDSTIGRVLKDCAIDTPKTKKPEYTFNQFRKDFNSLSAKKQKQVLTKLQKLVGK
jgi:hypothetical protein